MHIKKAIFRVLTVLIGSWLFVCQAQAQDSVKIYTKSHPLVYEDLWDMAPYSYLDENGVPCGYSIDLVKNIFERLNIPYVIKLHHSDEVFDDIAKGKADLTIGMYADYHWNKGHFGKSVVTLFTQSLAQPKQKKNVVKDINDLRGERVYARPSSYAYSEMVKAGLKRNIVPTVDLKAALMKVNETDSGVVLWNSMALKSIVKQYKLDNVVIAPIGMDHGEYRFLSQNQALLTLVDSVFVEMEMDETITQLRKTWFYPETLQDNTKKYFLYALSVAVVLMLCFTIYYVYFRYRERTMKALLERQNQRLSLYLESGKVRLFSYDVAKRTFHGFHAFSEGTNSDEVYTVASFAQYFVDKDFSRMMNFINELSAGMLESRKMRLSLRRTKYDSQLLPFELTLKVLRRDGKDVTVILGTLCNLDEEQRKAEELRRAVLKYRMMFDTAVADMIYCDNEGVILDINEKACNTFGINDKKQILDRRYSLGKARWLYNDDIDMSEKNWSTSIANVDDLRAAGLCDDLVTIHGRLYYELMIVPIFNNDGERIGIFITGRNVSETVGFMRREKLRTKRIQIATDRLQRYVNNINYALEVGQIRLAHYSPVTRSFDLVYDLNRQPLILSQLRCIKTIDEKDRQKAVDLILNMDRCRQKRFSVRVKTVMKDKTTGHDIYCQVSGVPLVDKDNGIQQYFCLLRDVTQLVATEEALQAQTQKAQEAETLKNTFLKNMSHEIRTPLNAVVGFAELFEQEHTPEDEVVFSNEIKSNSKKLLYLINDILLLSRIDAKMIEIIKEPVDFVDTFKTRCLMAWSAGVKGEVHTSIECQFEKLVVNVDANQLGYVVEQLAKMAARFTDHGFIRAKLDYFNGEMMMKFEDTGKGIDDETQKHIFEIESRFEGGYTTSGLELVIIYKLVKLMNGNIFVESQLGRGSTFRITIPCELEDKEKSEGTSTIDFSDNQTLLLN